MVQQQVGCLGCSLVPKVASCSTSLCCLASSQSRGFSCKHTLNSYCMLSASIPWAVHVTWWSTKPNCGEVHNALRVQLSSSAQSCPTLCAPMNRSTPGLPVHHQLPESTHTRVLRVGDAIQPSHPLSSPSPPALNLSPAWGQSSCIAKPLNMIEKFIPPMKVVKSVTNLSK